MFSGISRYRSVRDVTAPDSAGRVVVAKDIRPLPDVTGTFRHVVMAHDRLDHLATTYYGRSLDWWHICDANPTVLSPLALVSAEPVVTTEFPLPAGGGDPPWALLLSTVSGLLGVENVRVVDHVELDPQPPQGPEQVVVFTERPVRSVQVTHNRITVGAPEIATAIRAIPLRVGPYVELGQVGREIVVPPPVAR